MDILVLQSLGVKCIIATYLFVFHHNQILVPGYQAIKDLTI